MRRMATMVKAASEAVAVVRRNQPTTPAQARAKAQAHWQEHSPDVFGELAILESFVRNKRDEQPWAVVGAAVTEVLVRLTDEEGGSESLKQMLIENRRQYPSGHGFEVEVQEAVFQIVGAR